MRPSIIITVDEPQSNLQKKYLQTVPLIMRSSSTVNLHMKLIDSAVDPKCALF